LGCFTVAFDIDPAAVELNYQHCKGKGECRMLPLVMDFTNPTPALGWHNRERKSLVERARRCAGARTIHHLAISNTAIALAEFFADRGHWPVIEWVPGRSAGAKLPQVAGYFSGYHQAGHAFWCFSPFMKKCPFMIPSGSLPAEKK
jgi:hypothetical protein